MQTLSYNYKRPQTGDSGGAFFPALEVDIEQLNNHNHDGVNSAKLDSAAIIAKQQNVLAANWVPTSGGTYRQVVVMPTGLLYGFCYISFIFAVSGHQVTPTVEKISSNSYYVYTNDNSLAYTAVYVS